MNTSRTYSSAFVSCLAALLIACGGGGSGADDALEDFDPVAAVTEHERICGDLGHCSEECQQRLIAAGHRRCCGSPEQMAAAWPELASEVRP